MPAIMLSCISFAMSMNPGSEAMASVMRWIVGSCKEGGGAAHVSHPTTLAHSPALQLCGVHCHAPHQSYLHQLLQKVWVCGEAREGATRPQRKVAMHGGHSTRAKTSGPQLTHARERGHALHSREALHAGKARGEPVAARAAALTRHRSRTSPGKSPGGNLITCVIRLEECMCCCRSECVLLLANGCARALGRIAEWRRKADDWDCPALLSREPGGGNLCHPPAESSLFNLRYNQTKRACNQATWPCAAKLSSHNTDNSKSCAA